MRLLVVGLNYAPEPTGIAPYTTAFCRRLVARGHKVRVLTTMPHYPDWRVAADLQGWRRDEVMDGVRVVRLGHFVPRRPGGLLRLLSELSFGLRVGLARWGNPDVVVFVSPALFSIAVAILGRSPRQPYLLWVQDLYSLGLQETRGLTGALLARAVQRLESLLFRRADGIAVIHDRFAEFAGRLGADSSRVRVIRNWTHLAEQPAAMPEDFRSVFGARTGEVVVLHSGAMGRKQDLRNVVEAARIAAERGKPVRFVLMGNGEERALVQRAALGVPTLTIVDPVPSGQFPRALAAADVLLVNEHAGLREMAVPSKLTSYFASGRPVVAATDRGSVTASEIATSGAGIRVDPANPEALLGAVMELANNKDQSERFGAAGQRYRAAALGEEVAIDRFEGWLLELHRKRTRRSFLAK